MTTSFFLLAIIALLYYFDAKKEIILQTNLRLQKVVSQLRRNPRLHPKNFEISIDDASKYNFPAFKLNDKEVAYIACANKFYPNKVFVVKTSSKLIKEAQKRIIQKIVLAYILLFFPFLIVSYFLAKNALKPTKEAYKALHAFTQDIIHDIKTPITTISLNSELLQCENQKSLQRLRIAVSTIKDLYKNLEQFMLFQKSYQAEKFDLQNLLSSRIEYLRSINDNVNFTLNIPAHITIYTDKTMFMRIVDNLLINAIKYSNPLIDISIAYNDGKLRIENQGKPIKNPQSLFNRNYREALYIPGYGLGMNIVKKLLDTLHIPIQIQCDKNKTVIILDISSVLASKTLG